MNGLMMDYPLTLSTIFRRAESLFGHREVVWRAADRSIRRYNYAAFAERTRHLARALLDLGIHPAVLVDESLLALWERVRPLVNVPTVIVVAASKPVAGGYVEYESLISRAQPARDLPDLDERTAAAMCYTTGTTGNPKGVLYTHRSLVLHTLGLSLDHCMGIRESDGVSPVVPMFHANAWGMPFSAAMVGARLVMPGPHLDPESLVDLFHRERVTLTGGVPTIWMGVLQFLDANPRRYDLSAIRAMYV